jgi:DNA-directed RNA polymerase specialized sigma24 family protein
MTTPSTDPRLTTQQINQLVEQFRSGDSQAAETLLQAFDRYLHKWYRLLTQGYWDRRDQEIRHFLHMLGSVDLNQTALILAQRLKAYDREDLAQETKVTLLETFIRYGNASAMYRLVLKKRLADLTHDPLTFGFHQRRQLVEVQESPDLLPADINEAWVDGATCGPGFSELTAQERRVLQLTKWYGYTVERSAEVMGCSVSTVVRALRRAKEVLKIHYLD